MERDRTKFCKTPLGQRRKGCLKKECFAECLPLILLGQHSWIVYPNKEFIVIGKNLSMADSLSCSDVRKLGSCQCT